MAKAFLLLGSNLEDRKNSIVSGLKFIKTNAGQIIRQSCLYETSPWGNTQQQAFLNMVVEIETPLKPISLLNTLKDIEFSMGRKKIEKWGPRIIDIDILFYDSIVLNETTLTIPHPYLHQRMFTLIPLVEIAAEFIHPVFNQTIKALTESCPDTLKVKKYEDN